jgi:hypothetical protein
MNPHLNLQISRAQQAELARRVEGARHGAAHDTGATVRLATASDGAALERLSQLEGRRLPAGPTLVAERHGEVLAAISLEGEAIADPFRPTAELIELLEHGLARLRAAGGRGSRRGRLGAALRRRFGSGGAARAGAPTVPGSETLLLR